MESIAIKEKKPDFSVENTSGFNFDTEYLKLDLKGRSIRGGAITTMAQVTRGLLHMVSTIVMARLLAPSEFGLIAMVATVTTFAMMFKDMGLSAATIQKAEINHAQVSTLFWINICVSLIIVVCLAALAPAVAWFYDKSELTLITIVIATTFILGGATIQHQALLARHMQFMALGFIEVLASVISIATGIITAIYGAGYWSLVFMQIAGALCNAIGVWIVCPWRPGMPTRHSGIRPMLAFGGNFTAYNFLNYFARNLDNVLIGKFWGTIQLGLYSKAYGLLLFPINQVTNPITRVAIPTLSRLQNEPEKYRHYYYRAINLIAFITIPLVMVMAALSKEIVILILGEQWLEAGMIFKALAFAAVIQPVVATTGWVFISMGRTKRMLHWGLISVPIFICSFIIGLMWGALGVAICYAFSTVVILTVPNLHYAFRDSPVNVAGFFKAITCPIVIGLIMYVIMELTKNFLVSYGSVYIVLCSCITGLLVFVLMLLSWPRARDEAMNVLRLVKLLRNQPYEGNNESPEN